MNNVFKNIHALRECLLAMRKAMIVIFCAFFLAFLITREPPPKAENANAAAEGVTDSVRLAPKSNDRSKVAKVKEVKTRPSKSKVDRSEAMQEKRRSFIKKLIAARVFTKTDMPGYLPRVYIGPAFYGLDFDQKRDFVSVIYAYYYDGSDPYALVRLIDGRNNKSIGTFSLALGLDLN